MTESDLLFAVDTPLGVAVRVTHSQWRRIAEIKHPVMAGREAEVRATLADPVEFRQSRQAADVFLRYGVGVGSVSSPRGSRATAF